MLMLTSGPAARAEAAWIACASSSLPVPVSPSSSTGLDDSAARLAWRLTSTAAGLPPTKLARVYLVRRWLASSRRASSRSRCRCANLLISGCSVVSGWSNSTMPIAPISSPLCSSRSGMRLTTKVPARLVSRSIRIAWPVSSTRRICVLGTTSSTMWPDELVHRRKAQRRQEALVAFVEPDDAAGAIHQEHALADAGEQVEHRARGQLQDALAVARQGVPSLACADVTAPRSLGGKRLRPKSREISIV